MIENYLVYLDLPPVPEELIDPIEDIINGRSMLETVPNTPCPPESYYYFQVRAASPKLIEWTRDTFKTCALAKYQIIREGIEIHNDIPFGRRVGFNYIIQTGGPRVSTNIYDENKKLICSEIIQPKRWHRLKIDEYHDVTGMVTERIAINITLQNYVWNDPKRIW